MYNFAVVHSILVLELHIAANSHEHGLKFTTFHTALLDKSQLQNVWFEPGKASL